MKIQVLIPQGVDILVKPGQKVTFDTPFIKKVSTEEVKISLASSLGISPDKIFLYLHKFVGDAIQKDELLAEKKSFMSTKQYLSEYTGTIKEINHYDGSLTVESQLSETLEERCFFQGEIDAMDAQSLVLKVNHAKQYLLQEACPFFGGPMFVYTPENASQVVEDDVNGAIIVADSITSYDHMKLEALGAAGFITVKPLEEQAAVPTAHLKELNDLEEIAKNKFTCCMIAPDHTTIYIYD